MGRKHRRDKERGNDFGGWGESDFDEQPYSKTQILKVKPFKAKTDSQKEAYEIIKSNTLTFLGGVAGTGKTLLACHLALDYLSKGVVKKIVITRPNVEAAKSLGYLPGSASDKLLPYLIPIYDNFGIYIEQEKLKELLDENIIEIVPVGYMRGRTISDAFLIVDEAQNMTSEQLRMVLTRIGFGSTVAVTYDPEQIDIKIEQSCALDMNMFRGYNTIGHYEFDPSDVVRSDVVKLIIEIYNKNKEKNERE